MLAWWVVVGHMLGSAGFTQNTMPDGFAFLRSGEIAVYVFMIISGFVITHLLTVKQEAYSIYIMRRFLRLFPVFFLVITVVFFSFHLGVPIRGGGEGLWVHYLLESTMLHGAVPDTLLDNASKRLGGPGWSISLEWQFYLIAPFLMYALRNHGIWQLVLLVVIIVLAWSQFLGNVDRWIFPAWSEPGPETRVRYSKPSFIVIGLPYFLIGILSYTLLKWVREHADVRQFTAPAAIIVGLTLITVIEVYEVTIALFVWGLIFVSVCNEKSVLARAGADKRLSWLGEISYSTYITHMPVLAVMETLVMSRLGVEQEWIYFGTLAAVAVPPILLVSVACYYGIEKPAIQFGRKLAKRMEKGRSERAEARSS